MPHIEVTKIDTMPMPCTDHAVHHQPPIKRGAVGLFGRDPRARSAG